LTAADKEVANGEFPVYLPDSEFSDDLSWQTYSTPNQSSSPGAQNKYFHGHHWIWSIWLFARTYLYQYPGTLEFITLPSLDGTLIVAAVRSAFCNIYNDTACNTGRKG
jgi:hypothetical protein